MLAIVDYDAGNQTSVRRALEHMGIPCRIVADPACLDEFSGVIFPGVGSASQAMIQLARAGMDSALRRCAHKGQPLLGICLGCQILLESSEEGDTPTLGILPGKCLRFADDLREENGEPAKIPHMGWNSLERQGESKILAGIPQDAEFYFVHSYYAVPEPSLVLATTFYGHKFCSVYGRDGLWAAQFHPEKSGESGLAFLKNFNSYCMEQAQCSPKE